METQEQKKGKGRPSGTKSYAAVKISDLQNLAKDGVVPVSKKWLKQVGANILDYPDYEAPVVEVQKRIKIEKSVVIGAAKPSQKEIAPEDQIEFRVEA